MRRPSVINKEGLQIMENLLAGSIGVNVVIGILNLFEGSTISTTYAVIGFSYVIVCICGLYSKIMYKWKNCTLPSTSNMGKYEIPYNRNTVRLGLILYTIALGIIVVYTSIKNYLTHSNNPNDNHEIALVVILVNWICILVIKTYTTIAYYRYLRISTDP